MPLLTARVAAFSEGQEDCTLNANRIKRLTGSDDISARELYQQQITIRPQAKLLMLTNHLPKFDFRDRAMVDRVRLVPFEKQFRKNKANTDFVESLVAEHLSQMFTWMARGAQRFYTNGGVCEPPAVCRQGLQDYIHDRDTVAQFAEQHLTKGGGATKRSDLYGYYRQYCERESVPPERAASFYTALEALGFVQKKVRGSRRFEAVFAYDK